MAHNEASAERMAKSSSHTMFPAELVATGTKRFEDFVKAQSELLKTVQETNQKWFDRAQSEANLTSELVSKLTAARSMPEAMTACQEWTTRRIELMEKDGRALFGDAQKFMETATRLLANGWVTGKRGGVST